MFATLSHTRKCLSQFSRFFATPLSGSGRSAALGTACAATLFSMSSPVILVNPFAGHMLFAGQVLGILILAARYGRGGSWAGYLITSLAYLGGVWTAVLASPAGAALLQDVPIVLGI